MSVLTTATQELQLHHTQPALNLEPLNCIWSIPVSELNPTHTSIPCSPFNCWIHPISEMQGWMVPWILPAIQAQCPSCHLACRAQSLQFLGSTLHRSTQGSTSSLTDHGSGIHSRAELWLELGSLQSKPWLSQLQCYKVLHCQLQLSLSSKASSYQLESFSWKLQSRRHYPFATTNIWPFKNISLEYQWGQKNSLGTGSRK